jgi:hypothetical protein
LTIEGIENVEFRIEKWRGGMYNLKAGIQGHKAPRTQGPRNSRTQELKNIGPPEAEIFYMFRKHH